MLFVFEDLGEYGFWMKDTLIPLDIIWIDSDWRVVGIADAELCYVERCPVYRPRGKAKYVLEVNSGWAEEKGLGVGDLIDGI